MDVIKTSSNEQNKNTTLSNLARCMKHKIEKAKSCCRYAISKQCEQSEALYTMSPTELVLARIFQQDLIMKAHTSVKLRDIPRGTIGLDCSQISMS